MQSIPEEMRKVGDLQQEVWSQNALIQAHALTMTCCATLTSNFTSFSLCKIMTMYRLMSLFQGDMI